MMPGRQAHGGEGAGGSPLTFPASERDHGAAMVRMLGCAGLRAARPLGSRARIPSRVTSFTSLHITKTIRSTSFSQLSHISAVSEGAQVLRRNCLKGISVVPISTKTRILASETMASGRRARMAKKSEANLTKAALCSKPLSNTHKLFHSDGRIISLPLLYQATHGHLSSLYLDHTVDDM